MIVRLIWPVVLSRFVRHQLRRDLSNASRADLEASMWTTGTVSSSCSPQAIGPLLTSGWTSLGWSTGIELLDVPMTPYAVDGAR